MTGRRYGTRTWTLGGNRGGWDDGRRQEDGGHRTITPQLRCVYARRLEDAGKGSKTMSVGGYTKRCVQEQEGSGGETSIYIILAPTSAVRHTIGLPSSSTRPLSSSCPHLGHRTARGLQYSGPVITLRVQHGLQIQYNTIHLGHSASVTCPTLHPHPRPIPFPPLSLQ